MPTEDEILLNEFRIAIRKHGKENVIDLDGRYPHKFDFQIHRFEDVVRETNGNIPPNRWSYHRIGLITAGSGEFTTGTYKFTAKRNTLVVAQARIITSSTNWTPDTKGYVVVFNVDFFLQNHFPGQFVETKSILTKSIQPYVCISDLEAEEISGIFETIISERNNEDGRSELLALKVVELIIQSERLFDKQLHFKDNQPIIDIVSRFMELVENNFTAHRSVGFYAGQLNVHANYLNAVVKKQTGITAKETIQKRMILETKYMLHSTQLSVKEIAANLGFEDPNYFTSFFTRLEKISPRSYRASFV
jgi:AraC family transcriptional activator of pobA